MTILIRCAVPTAAELENLDIVSGQTFEVLWNNTFWAMTNYNGQGGVLTEEGDTINTTNNYVTKIPYGVDVGGVNAVVVDFTPAITAPVPGDAVEVKLANTITGASSIVINGMAAVALVRPNGAGLQSGDGAVGQIALLMYRDDNTWQFESIIPQAFSGVGMSVGTLLLSLSSNALPNTVAANGATLAIAQHPRLWEYAYYSGRMVQESDWVNWPGRFWTSFSGGDWATWFRLPDLRGEFLRMWDGGSRHRSGAGHLSAAGRWHWSANDDW